MSTLHKVEFEVGGHEVVWHVRRTKGSPATLTDPKEEDEYSFERAELLVGLTPEGCRQTIDILDLIIEVCGDDISDHIFTEVVDQIGEEE